MPTRLLRALVFFAVLSLTLINAYGQTLSWSGPNSGSWSLATNWTPNGVPGLTNDVVIYHPSGDSVNLDSGTASINSLTLGGSGLPSSSVLTGNGATNLTIVGNLTVGQSGDLELQAGDTVTVGNGTGNFGILQNSGRLYVGPGAHVNIPDDTTTTVVSGSTFFIEGTLTPQYFVDLTTIQGATGSAAPGELHLDNGIHNWTFQPLGGTLTNSGQLIITNGTGLIILGDVVNNLILTTGYPSAGGNDALFIPGNLTNNFRFEVGNGDRADVGSLVNNGVVLVDSGATLNLFNQPSIPDIPPNTIYSVGGTITVAGGQNAFWNLATNEGVLYLNNGLTTDITPIGGTLDNLFSGQIIMNSSTLNFTGTLTNEGLVIVGPGTTLNLLSQPNGITDVVAGSEFDLYGTFNAGALSGFNSLSNVEGRLILENGQTIADTLPGKLFVTGPGYFEVKSGTTFTRVGNLVLVSGGISINDPGPTTVNITGTLTNLGGQINVFGPQAVLNAGSIVNGGMLSLPEGSTVNVANGFYQLAAGTLGEGISASGFSILVAADGQVMLAGTLDVMLDPGFNPAIGTSYEFIVFQPGELSGTFASIQNKYFNGGTEGWIVIYNNADGYVELEAAPAPEPASFLLLGSGLLSAALGIRRRWM